MNETHPLKKVGLVMALAALVGLVLAGFASILDARLSSGEIYLHYSTQRADPLGTRALYDAFDRLPEYEVSRNSRSLAAIDTLDGDTTLLLLGFQRFDAQRAMSDQFKGALEAAKNDGTRLVMVINPQFVPGAAKEGNSWFDKRDAAIKEKETKEEEAKEEDTKEEALPDREGGALLFTEMGVKISQPAVYEKPEGGWEAELGEDFGQKMAVPIWQTPQYFANLDDEWSVVATVEHDEQTYPVVIERPWGEGSIVLTSDAYFASNEALWRGGEIDFLLWMTGGKKRLVFDETIHYAQEGGSIMKLIRKHRLEGFFIGAILFILLLAWRSGTSLVPGNESVERGLVDGDSAVSGESTHRGFVRLLARSIPPKALLAQCVKTWRETGAGVSGPTKLTEAQEAVIESAVASAEENPRKGLLPGYEKIVDLLKRQRGG